MAAQSSETMARNSASFGKQTGSRNEGGWEGLKAAKNEVKDSEVNNELKNPSLEGKVFKCLTRRESGMRNE